MGLWRVHVELEDRPGRLGELAAAVGGSGCNIVSLTVLGERGPDGSVTDELLVDAPVADAATALADRLRGAGIGCTLAVPVDAGELRDPATTALALARRVAGDPETAADAVASMLNARVLPTGTTARHVHRLRVLGRDVPLGRAWPFTATEMSRAAMLVALAELCGRLRDATGPSRGEPASLGLVLLGDGSEVELRPVTATDGPLVAALHARCSPSTRHARFLSPSPTPPPGELAELLAGRSGKGDGLLALTTDGGHAVGLATLDPSHDGVSTSRAALSVLVEDAWQARGVGTALVRRAVELAADAGWHELSALAHPGNLRITRLLRRAGLRPTAQLVDGLLRVDVSLRDP